MNIQSNTTNSMQVSFNRLIIKKGSFDALKQSEYFPKDKNHPRYSDSMHDFYSKLIKLKRRAEENDLYNVILKPQNGINEQDGCLVIENKAGYEQAGFKKSFSELMRVKDFEPKKFYTKSDISNPISRWYKNTQISKNNKKIMNQNPDLKQFLDVIYKRIEVFVNNAEYLADLHRLKKGS